MEDATHRPRGWLVASAGFALAVYALLWIGYAQRWEWLSRLDDAALNPAHAYGAAHSGWVSAWDWFCTILGPNAFRLAVAVLVVALFWRRRPRPAVFLVVTVELSGVVNELAKALVQRPRPPTALVSAYASSFPSGHAMGIVVCVLALLAVVTPKVTAALRPWLWVLGAALIVTIGVGRVLLNVHHPSDVLAGWALGYAYFIACLLVLPPWPVRSAAGTPPMPDTAP